MSVTLIVILAAIGGVAFFVLLWCAICLALANLGGWQSLAKHFATMAAPHGVRHGMASARIGGVKYNRSLTLYVADDGIFLAPLALFKLGHPDLFIPWIAIRDRKERKLLGWQSVVLTIGEPQVTTITLAKKLLDGGIR